MLPMHRGPCLACGKVSDNLMDDNDMSDIDPRDTQDIMLDDPEVGEHSHAPSRMFPKVLLFIVVLGLMAAAFSAGFYWKDVIAGWLAR